MTYLFIRKLMLQRRGHTVLRVDAVVIDYNMPGMDGATLSTIIRREFSRLPIVLLSGFAAEVPKHLRGMFNAVVAKGQAQTATSLRKILEDVMGVSARSPQATSRNEDGLVLPLQ